MGSKDRNPKIATSPPNRQPVIKGDPASFDKLKLRLRLDLLDIDHPKWGWKRLTKEEHLDFLKFIKDLESQTWAEIRQASGGKGDGKGTNHHPVELHKLRHEAKNRICELRWQGIIGDTIFSLRINATTRLYGHRDEGYFRPIWHDPFHSRNHPDSLYPLS
ncbi:MAG TPA: hypothetical protein VLE95_08925 [Chlamydiales bacterium]|nr:hypothetical protein [Chlamydiales bacterium]